MNVNENDSALEVHARIGDIDSARLCQLVNLRHRGGVRLLGWGRGVVERGEHKLPPAPGVPGAPRTWAMISGVINWLGLFWIT